MSGDLLGVVLAAVLLALNAFFVGAEFSLLSARRSQVEPLAQAGSRAARTTLKAMENVEMAFAALVGTAKALLYAFALKRGVGRRSGSPERVWRGAI